MKKWICVSSCFFLLLTGCSKFIHYRPAPPENMRATDEEKAALKELEKRASKEHAKFNKEQVMADFLKISKHDGISEKEAVVIAQSEALFRGLEGNYQLGSPAIAEEADTEYMIQFPAIPKRFVTAIQPRLNVFVNRQSGTATFKP